MLSFFSLWKKKSATTSKDSKNATPEENNDGIIGKYIENSLPVIVKFVNVFPEKVTRLKYPILTVVSWKYKGNENNGMPPKTINEKMIYLENALLNVKDSSELFIQAYSRTGNNLKELVYYSVGQKEFMKDLNLSLKKYEKLPITIDFYEDAQWTEFRKLLNDFNK